MSTKSQIIQVAPNLTAGDAISNYAQTIDIILKQEGFSSFLLAERVTNDFQTETFALSKLPDMLHDSENTTILYHHSLGSSVPEYLSKLPQIKACQRALCYHNITPPWLLGFAPDIAAQSWQGLQQLTGLYELFSQRATAASQFSANDLIAHGWDADNVSIVPLVMDENFAASLLDNSSTASSKPIQLLYVGRIVPNKGIETLLQMLALLHRNPAHRHVRLNLVGNPDLVPAYTASLRTYATELFGEHAAEAVCFAGKVSHRELIQVYKQATLFVMASHHEGFCMPLVEAMFAKLPVVALNYGAVPETLSGGAGIVLTHDDPAHFAETVALLLETPDLRQTVCSAQKHIRERFTVAHQTPTLLRALGLA